MHNKITVIRIGQNKYARIALLSFCFLLIAKTPFSVQTTLLKSRERHYDEIPIYIISLTAKRVKEDFLPVIENTCRDEKNQPLHNQVKDFTLVM
jgi:hypothetical protein